MYSIFNLIILWTLRHLISLVLIIVVLIAANFIRKEFVAYQSLGYALQTLEVAEQSINTHRRASENDVLQRIGNTKSASFQALNIEINSINQEIKEKKLQQQNTGNLSTLLKKFPGISGVLENRKLEIEILLLVQARDYLMQLKGSIDGKNQLNTLQKTLSIANRQLINNERAQKRLKTLHPIATKNPAYYEFWTLNDLEQTHTTLLSNKQVAERNFINRQKTSKPQLQPFEIDTSKLDQALEPLFKKIIAVKERAENNWFVMLSKQVSEVILIAVGIWGCK